ncbi:MAG: tetratricopeptide repeat protein [Pyrinomonadaceae bacterium]
MRYRILLFAFVFLFAANSVFTQGQTAVRTITVITEPNAAVWIDDVLRGKTDKGGKLVVKPVNAGIRKLRIRADGFKEVSQNLIAAQKGDVKIILVKTTDEAELAFQEAEAETNKTKAVESYEKAVKLRPKYAEAYLGLARALESQSDYDGALEAIKKARKARPIFPEASAVEGRIYKDAGEDDKTAASFNRAIKEGKGFQPEAHTGLALFYKDKAFNAGSSGDLETEKQLYAEAITHFEKAIEQLSATEPVVYLLLGEIYEKQKKFPQAIKIYEKFIRDFPDSDERTAVESFIVQIKKQMQVQ